MSGKLHITEVGRVAVPASDQDRALEFYVGTLGFELRSDVTFADGKMRWIEVVPAGSSTSIALTPPMEGGPGALDDHERALERLKQVGVELERDHPGAAGSLREGLAETLTLTRLGISGSLKRTLASTNPCESMIECVRRTSRNVKRWSSGEMALRWTAAGMLEAERQFRRIIGYRELATLVVAIDRELTAESSQTSDRKEADILLSA